MVANSGSGLLWIIILAVALTSGLILQSRYFGWTGGFSPIRTKSSSTSLSNSTRFFRSCSSAVLISNDNPSCPRVAEVSVLDKPIFSVKSAMINTSLLCWRNFPSATAIPDSATNSPATPIVMNRPPSIVNTCIHAKAGPFRLLCPVLAIMAPYSRINPNATMKVQTVSKFCNWSIDSSNDVLMASVTGIGGYRHPFIIIIAALSALLRAIVELASLPCSIALAGKV